MPYVLNDDNTVSAVDVTGSVKTAAINVYSPKFFHKTLLTGKGGTSKGLLNVSNDPKMFKNGYPNSINPAMTFGSHYNKDIKIYDIPCFLITPSMWDYIKQIERPDAASMTLIATKGNDEIYLDMPLHAIQIQEYQVFSQTTGDPMTKKDLSACMQMFLYSVIDKNTTVHNSTKSFAITRTENTFRQKIVHNMFEALQDTAHELEALGYSVNKTAMNDFLQNYSLYVELCKASERWQTNITSYIVDILIKNINRQTLGQPDALWTDVRDSVMDVLSRLEKYSVPLNQYQEMYTEMEKIVSPDILTLICKANLNLRLSNTMSHMNQNRAQLNSYPCKVHIQSKIPYSQEQQKAIESSSPLTLVQSGAGTGKSTVILGRIDHMLANGVDPKDITVLSFTNAAANHISDLKPEIHSMTIASMLHSIYENNYPTHQLSSLSTIINSLDIYFDLNSPTVPSSQKTFIPEFRYVLERLRDNNEYTRANNFIEDHIDEVIDVLDVIQQTSLELESIICYQKMDTLVEPTATQTKHLIIDEVQDNSIAEFIYSLKYTDKHKNSMYIVGDCSQTLFEFRSSNPKALNMLESSGVFETHKLQINYRSNQEILDFANVLLGNIEANQYANIQLKANSLKPVTLKSFKDAVTLQYTKLPNKSVTTIESMIAHAITFDTHSYISDKLNKGEQVCILAPQRSTLNSIEKYLRANYPDKTIASLIPRRQYDSTIFSKFIAKYWNLVKFTPPLHLIEIIEKQLFANLLNLTYKAVNAQKVHDNATKLMDDFKQTHGNTILGWEKQVTMSVMTHDQLLDEVKKLMISFEIQKNNIAQAMLSSKNAEAKNASDVDNANFILSTIHSAKGLEFDNVIVFCQAESKATIEEATKRMYYVAFTRAKKTEFIFAYNTLARPDIQGDYERIIKTLDAAQKKQNNSNGNNSDNALANESISASDADDSTVMMSESVSEDANNLNGNSSDNENDNEG